ncbi:MAG: GldG family protein, partial [Limisphaerales bacterium]
MFLILVAVGIIAGSAKFRLDFTADKIYTLSEGTKKILGQLDTPVKIHFYCTQSDAEMPVPLKAYAKRVEDLLTEYRQISKGRVQIVKFDPQPDSDAEESARIDGVEGQVMGRGGIIGMGDKAYLGLAVICVDQKTALPFLDPNREK